VLGCGLARYSHIDVRSCVDLLEYYKIALFSTSLLYCVIAPDLFIAGILPRDILQDTFTSTGKRVGND